MDLARMEKPRTKHRRTLVEVARLCKVSESTVSRVLSNRKYGRFSVSPEVRERIIRVAREVDYRPSVAARNMSAARTNLVAVLGVRSIDPTEGGPIERAIAFLAQRLDDEGYDICMQLFSRRHHPFDLPMRVDGVVVVGAEKPDDLAAVESSGSPYVSINGVVGPGGLLVTPDDRAGTCNALKHLVELGHRKIAYFDHPAVDALHPSVFERRSAFLEASKQMGFSVPKTNIPRLAARQSWDSSFEPFIQQAIVAGGATAVLTYSHYAALGLLSRAPNFGLKIPDDFSLVCFNDEVIVSLSVPPLTAIAWPSREVGEIAANLLLARMAGEPATAPSHKLAEQLIVRRSTAAPPALSRTGKLPGKSSSAL